MHFKGATKMEQMKHKTADTLQLHFFLFEFWPLSFLLSVHATGMFYGAVLLVLIPLVIAIVIIQPYKPRFSTYNAVDSVLFLVLALTCATGVCVSIQQD